MEKPYVNIRFRHVLLFIGIVYLVTLKGTIGNLHPNRGISINTPPFETSMERGRYAQIISLAENGDFNVNEFYTFLKPDIAWYDGNFYSTFPVGVAVLAVPFYILGKSIGMAQLFTFAVSAIFSLATAYLIWRIALMLRLSEKAAIFSALVFGLASVAWPYSVSLSAHPVSAFVITLGVFLALLIDKKPHSYKYHMLVGLLLGSGFFVDYPNLAIFWPIFVFVLFKSLFSVYKIENVLNVDLDIPSKKGILLMILGFLVFIAIFGLYNQIHYKRPIAFSNTFTIKFLETSGIDFEKITLTNDLFKDRVYSKRFSIEQAISGVQTLLWSSDRGLLLFSPIFALAFYGFALLFLKRKILFLVFFFTFLINIVLYGSYDDPWGGWSFGPRYLIVSLPILAVVCGLAYDNLVYKYSDIAKLVIFILLTFSAGVSVLGSLTTNAVPPSIETVGSNMKSNFLYNWDYLQNNGTSSFVYNTFLDNLFSPYMYGVLVFLIVMVGQFVFVFKRR